MDAKFYIADSKLIPADDNTYELLCTLGCSSTRINITFFPLLKEILQKKHISVSTQPISELFSQYKLTTQNFWAEKFLEKDNTFVLSGKNTQNNKDKLIKLEHQWRKVFNRFGYTGEFKYDETASRIKMTITYEISDALPEIKLKRSIDLNTSTLNLDGYILTLCKDKDKIRFIVNVPYDSQPIVNATINSVQDDGFLAFVLSSLR